MVLTAFGYHYTCYLTRMYLAIAIRAEITNTSPLSPLFGSQLGLLHNAKYSPINKLGIGSCVLFN